MEDTFKPKLNSKVKTKRHRCTTLKTPKYGNKSLKLLDTKIWCQIRHIESLKHLFIKLRNIIETSFGLKCRCNVCANISVLLRKILINFSYKPQQIQNTWLEGNP